MALISSDGQLTRIEPRTQPGPTWVAPTSVVLDGQWHDYAWIWETQLNVRTVVAFLGRNIAQLGLKVYRRNSDTERAELSGHPLADTLERPNGFTTRYRLIDSLVQSIALYDNALWVKSKNPANVAAGVRLIQVPWYRVELIGGNWLAADAYRIKGTDAYVDIPADRCVHFRGFNPTDPRQGVSPMQTLRRILNEDAAAGNAREAMWRNGARHGAFLTRPAGAKWSPEAKERFKAAWKAWYSGTSNAGETPLLEDGMEAKPWPSQTAEDTQYIEARKLTREEVAAAFHIPPPMVGILDHATFSNIDTQHRMLYQDTLGPWLAMIEQEIELQLLGEYEDTDRVYVEFNLAEKLKGSFEEQAKTLKDAVGTPWLTVDEARARLNLPPVPGGGQLIRPLNVGTSEQSTTGADLVPPKAAAVRDREKALAAYFDRMGRSLLSEIGATNPTHIDQIFEQTRWRVELDQLGLAGVDTTQVVSSIRAALADALQAEQPKKAARDVFDQAKTVWAEALASIL